MQTMSERHPARAAATKELSSEQPAALKFDRTVKAGDVLTSITVLLSAVALTLSLARDAGSRTYEQANKVRAAAAQALVKLDRW